MQHFGRRVVSVGPNDGSRLRVHCHAREVLGVAQRFSERSPQVIGEVSLGHRAVVERQSQTVVVQHFDSGHTYGHSSSMLRQRRDGLRTLPVLSQLGPVNQRPLPHQAHRPGRQMAVEQPEVFDRKLCPHLAVLGVKVQPVGGPDGTSR